MKYCYIIFEYWHDVSCDKQHESSIELGKDKKPKKYRCGNPIHCSRIVLLTTTDEELAITLTKNNPNYSYQKEVLWTNLT